MSTISKQVEELRKLAKKWRDTNVEVYNKLTGAADTIETLSAKVRANNLHGGWIPVSYHEITEEEREEKGYPKDWVYLLDCEMPQDEQEILVQVKNGEIRWDVCYLDDGFSLDSGWDWADDVVAWMPLPEPYKGGDTVGGDTT